MQLREFAQMEPDLVRYLSDVLSRVTQHPATEAALHLNVLPPQKPSHRPPNSHRQRLMLLFWKAACDWPSIDRGDETHIKAEAARIDRIEDEAEQYAQLVDWYRDDYQDAEKERRKSAPSTFEFAARMFNHALSQAQADGRRQTEKPVTGGAIRSAVYRMRKKFSKAQE
ncbi:hypothetical protein EZJ19_05720 [Parasulfuritortus cantonensis]|uniref:Uncharacterized protein n=1 Tax=Parasulfuritortus cantonensis TaxID=2528202 RepID=A0A4R1BFZ0_9PROT|nr:hypothetical protein [Parasulfuritortus cantonensis]TCJ16090.1 hypothetical protein EZJ19_05720 [Parasulfuritortus cantonensis]